MNKLKKFNDVRYQFLVESINELEQIDMQLVLEGIDIGKYQRATKKLISDVGIDLYGVGKFGVSVTALYPVIFNLIKNGNFNIQCTVENVVLITTCALTILVKENKEKAQKLVNYATEKGMTEKNLDKIIKQITTIKGIFAEIAKNFGKQVTTFSNMLAYTSLLVPFSMVLDSLLTQGLIDGELLVQSLPALEVSLGNVGYKLLFNRIMHKLEILIQGTDKFRNSENIKPLLVNDEWKSPELRPKKIQIVKDYETTEEL